MKSYSIHPVRHSPASCESGAALIAVLSLMLLMAVIVASVVTSSQSTRFAVAASTQMSDSVYYSESAAARGLWLLMNDKAKFTNRIASKKSDTPEVENERFVANGATHRIECDNIAMSLKITDMFSGINIAGFNPAEAMNYMSTALEKDPERRDELEAFKTRLMDYVDQDDHIRPNSMESADYTSLDLTPLPRNSQMEYREEILLIPGCGKFFPPDENGVLSCINIIPPARVRVGTNTRPNLYSAPDRLIKDMCNLEEDELALVKEALDRCREEQLSLEDAFYQQPQLLTRLKAQFSTSETGYFTLTIRPAPDAGIAGRTLVISLKVDSNITSDGLHFIQWQLY